MSAWVYSTKVMLGTHVAPPVVIGNCVWTVIGGAELLAIDAVSGQRRWSAPGRYSAALPKTGRRSLSVDLTVSTRTARSEAVRLIS